MKKHSLPMREHNFKTMNTIPETIGTIAQAKISNNIDQGNNSQKTGAAAATRQTSTCKNRSSCDSMAYWGGGKTFDFNRSFRKANCNASKYVAALFKSGVVTSLDEALNASSIEAEKRIEAEALPAISGELWALHNDGICQALWFRRVKAEKTLAEIELNSAIGAILPDHEEHTHLTGPKPFGVGSASLWACPAGLGQVYKTLRRDEQQGEP
jgi:hypothetical protein